MKSHRAAVLLLCTYISTFRRTGKILSLILILFEVGSCPVQSQKRYSAGRISRRWPGCEPWMFLILCACVCGTALLFCLILHTNTDSSQVTCQKQAGMPRPSSINKQSAGHQNMRMMATDAKLKHNYGLKTTGREPWCLQSQFDHHIVNTSDTWWSKQDVKVKVSSYNVFFAHLVVHGSSFLCISADLPCSRTCSRAVHYHAWKSGLSSRPPLCFLTQGPKSPPSCYWLRSAVIGKVMQQANRYLC